MISIPVPVPDLIQVLISSFVSIDCYFLMILYGTRVYSTVSKKKLGFILDNGCFLYLSKC